MDTPPTPSSLPSDDSYIDDCPSWCCGKSSITFHLHYMNGDHLAKTYSFEKGQDDVSIGNLLSFVKSTRPQKLISLVLKPDPDQQRHIMHPDIYDTDGAFRRHDTIISEQSSCLNAKMRCWVFSVLGISGREVKVFMNVVVRTS